MKKYYSLLKLFIINIASSCEFSTNNYFNSFEEVMKVNPNPAEIFSNLENIAPTGLFILPGTVKIKVFELRKAKRSVIQALKLSVSLYL